MDARKEIVNSFYDGYFEDSRLIRSRHGQLEYLTTMHFINKFAAAGCSIIELGAGTGRYSVALAKAGHNVTAVELAEKNFELLVENGRGVKSLTALHGDALDLSRFADDSFDLTLVFGPMYHVYDEAERMTVLREAVRVTKPGGVILTAFLSIHAIMYDNYLQNNFEAGLIENFTPDYAVRHFAEQVFTGYNIDEFEAQFDALPVDHITTAAADGMLELASGRGDFALSDEDFKLFAEYHLHHCERRELLGLSSHLIHVCRKRCRK